MKRCIIVAIYLVIIGVIGNSCFSRAGNSNNVTSNAVVVSSPSPSPVSNNQNVNTGLQGVDDGLEETDPAESEDSEDEGYREAEKFWKPYAPTCSGVTYIRSGKQGFLELNGFRITVEYDPVTQADQLNGIEAKGMSRIQSDTYRSFYDAKWHEWENGSPTSLGRVAHFKRFKGQWKFEGGATFDDSAQMNCSEIPRSTNAANSLLRFDGVYRAYGEDADPKDDTTYWFKFYQDGTAASVANQNAGFKNSGAWWTVGKVWDCLTSPNQGSPCRPEVAQGTYSVKGSDLVYQRTQYGSTTKRTGTIRENSIKMVIGKKPNGSPVSAVFEFVEVSGN